MDKELAREIFDWIKAEVSALSDAAVKEMPILGQEIINWMIAESTLWVVVGLVPIVLGSRYIYKFAKINHSKDFDDGCAALSGCGIFIGAWIFIYNAIDLLKVLVAPKLVLIEYMSALIKPAVS